jgi:hypothetical protein
MYFVEPYQLQLELATQNFEFRDWYKGVLRTNSAYLSEVFTAQSTGEKTVKIAVPVRNEVNELLGIWGGILDLDFARTEIDRLSLNNDKRIVFFDHNGNIIADTLDQGFTTQEKESYYRQVVKALVGQSGNAINTIDSQKFFVTYGPVKTGSLFWGILIIEPYDIVFSVINSNREQIFFAISLVVTITVASSILRIVLVRKDNKNAMVQQKEIERLEEQLTRLDKKYTNLKKSHSLHTKTSKEMTQLSVRHYLTIISITVIFVAMMNVYLFFENQRIEHSIGLLSKPMQTGYVIQNLRGDTVDTWLSWKLPPGSTLTVNIKNSDAVSPEQLAAVKESILSEELIALEDSLLNKGFGTISVYYKGWKGALDSVADRQTELFIPNVIEVIESPSGEGSIVVEFTNLQNADGYVGYTKSISDESQILKSTITIYDVDELSPEEIGTITRHEFGHALGLAHSTAPEDLMAPVVQTIYPYISECAMDALVELYDGSQNSQIVCEK